MTAGAEAEALDRVAALLREVGPNRKVGVLTGAGISAPSGIPDFRSAGGIWDRYPPQDFATIDAFDRDPERVWGFLRELSDIVQGAEPNPAHLALAELERRGFVRAIVTQNVDGLHQRAGSERVIEFHGSGERLHCLRCDTRRDAAPVRAAGVYPPRCPRCDAIEKPDVVLFGEMIPPAALEQSATVAEECTLWLVAGTSAQVYPAAGIAMHAIARGLPVCEMNLESSLPEAAARVLGDLSLTLPELVDRI